MTVEVLEPNWHKFETKLRSVSTIDEVLRHHSELLDTCLKECLLTNQTLLRLLFRIFDTCSRFAEQIEQFMAVRLRAALAKSVAKPRPHNTARRRWT